MISMDAIVSRIYLHGSRGDAAYALRGKFKELKGRWDPERKLWWFHDAESWKAAREVLSAKKAEMITTPVDMFQRSRMGGGMDIDEIALDYGCGYSPGEGW